MLDVIEQELCFIYRSRDYQEHSLILDIISLNFGQISVLAHRVKHRNSIYLSLLQPFIPLKLSMRRGRNEGSLYYLIDAESCGEEYTFKPPFLYCATYMNELLGYLYHNKDGEPVLFASYVKALEQVSKKQNFELSLRLFELNLLDSLGYSMSPVDFNNEPLQNQKNYRFCYGVGFVQVDGQKNKIDEDDGLMFSKSKVKGSRMGDTYSFNSGEISIFNESFNDFIGPQLTGNDLKDILNRSFTLDSSIKNAKLLINSLFERVLQGRVINSRNLYREYIAHEKQRKANLQLAKKESEEKLKTENKEQSSKPEQVVEE